MRALPYIAAWTLSMAVTCACLFCIWPAEPKPVAAQPKWMADDVWRGRWLYMSSGYFHCQAYFERITWIGSHGVQWPVCEREI